MATLIMPELHKEKVLDDAGFARFFNVPSEQSISVKIDDPSSIIINPTLVGAFNLPTSLDNISQEVTIPADYDGSDITLNWFRYKNYADVKLWRKMQAVIAENRANGHITNYDTITQTSVSTNANQFSGMILSEIGRFLAVPNNQPYQNSFSITDFSSNTLLMGASGDNKWYGGVLLNNKSYGVIANTVSLGFTRLSVSSSGGPNDVENWYSNIPKTIGFRGGTLLSNGKVLMASSNFTHLPQEIQNIVYDYFSNEVIKIPIPDGYDASQYYSAQLLPDNKVIIFGAQSNKINHDLLYDVQKNTAIPILKSGTWTYGGTILEDETVFGNMYANPKLNYIIDPKTLSTRDLDYFPYSRNQSKSLLLHDGRVMRMGGTYNKVQLIDTVNETYSEFGASNVINGIVDARLLPDGRIVVLPFGAGKITVISASDGNYGTLPDMETLCSAYLNHL